jgi:general stress protein YciG
MAKKITKEEREAYAVVGRKGGKAIARKLGKKGMRELGKKGAEKRWAK